MINKWDSKSAQIFRETPVLLGSTFIDRLKNLQANADSIDNIDQLTKLLNDAASNSFNKMSKQEKKNKRQYYSRDVQTAKREFKKARRLVDNTLDRRLNFIRAKKKYKKVWNDFNKAMNNKQLKKLCIIEKGNPKLFWAMVRKLLYPTYKKKSQIEENEWIMYFVELYNVTTHNFDKSLHDYVKNVLPVLEKYDECNEDWEITKDDVIKRVKELKN